MARLKNYGIAALAAAAALAIFWVSREDLRLPWQRLRPYERLHAGCAAGFVSQDYAALKLPGAYTVFYLAWGDKFPSEELKRAGGRRLLTLTWEPYLKSAPARSLLGEIAAGRHDAYMRAMAASIKAYGGPVLLRWGHEPNGDWYPWSGAANINRPGVYAAAWRRMAGIVRSGAPKARLVFSVSSEDRPGAAWNRFERYYPGDAYVDAVGIDVYNWGDTQPWSSWKRPNMLLKEPYSRALDMAPSKPLLLTEVASCSSGGSRAEWLRRLFWRLKSRYTAIKGFMWFDYEKECDWRLSADPEAAAVYAAQLRDDGYFTSDPASLDWLFTEKI